MHVLWPSKFIYVTKPTAYTRKRTVIRLYFFIVQSPHTLRHLSLLNWHSICILIARFSLICRTKFSYYYIIYITAPKWSVSSK